MPLPPESRLLPILMTMRRTLGRNSFLWGCWLPMGRDSLVEGSGRCVAAQRPHAPADFEHELTDTLAGRCRDQPQGHTTPAETARELLELRRRCHQIDLVGDHDLGLLRQFWIELLEL